MEKNKKKQSVVNAGPQKGIIKNQITPCDDPVKTLQINAENTKI